jgi:glutaredoxin
VLELYQAEWCPHSHLVRERLTELGVPYLAHPVAADPAGRDEMRESTGSDTIPVAVLDDGTILSGEAEDIARELGRRFQERPDANRHREKDASVTFEKH